MSLPSSVWILYNTDYDAELCAAEGADVSAVAASAMAVRDGVRDAGYAAETVGVQGLDVAELIARLQREPPDLIFNLVESLNGDARGEQLMPALLDMLGVPYTGTAALGLGLCLHKERAKDVLVARGVPTPHHVLIADRADLEALPADLRYPYFLKLAHEDASVGISATNVVPDAAALRARAGELLDRYRQGVICEQFIDGREVNVTVLGTGAGAHILPLHEIDFSAMPAGVPHIISYAGKWDEGHPEYGGSTPVPMRDVSAALAARIEEVSLAAYRALEVRDYGRVDLRVDADERPWVVDVNPNCDISPDAGVARAAQAAGLSFPQLVARVIELAWQRRRR